MDDPRRHKKIGDATITLGPDLRDELDAYAQAMVEREPGIKASRSAAARQLLRRALRSIG